MVQEFAMLTVTVGRIVMVDVDVVTQTPPHECTSVVAAAGMTAKVIEELSAIVHPPTMVAGNVKRKTPAPKPYNPFPRTD